MGLRKRVSKKLGELLIYFVFPNPTSSGQEQRARIHLHVRCILQVKKLAPSKDRDKRLQFHDDFTKGSKCQFSLFVFFINFNYFLNRHFAQTKEKELEIVEN